MIEILACGSGLSLQDGGRHGWRRYGVPAGGAMDARSMALANTLLGNAPEAPLLEIVQQGAKIQILQDMWLALAGGDFCSDFATGCAQPVAAGQRLIFDKKATGRYSYLALPGGVQADSWLGSVAVDVRNGMGLPIQAGSRIMSQGAQPTIVTPQAVARRIARDQQSHIPGQEIHLKLYRGPQFTSFSSVAQQQFITNEWSVSTRSDRTGYRLEGLVLEVPASIASEPVLPGSFQVPGNGQPIITMHDGPTVGGYPKIAVLADTDLDRLAQCVPGTKLTFSWQT
ncbi:biotin-dependent carboxyltransferase family protein [Coraliomargarita sp. SDUM461004]|uniref:Biotin-dependent carboxyltransferase family protein n=1 Tax=Thalassobacterium sedimentorum TaxID=3041258 RepID=A0ABU1AG77_9BACT|nr:biotin-dependent carboxyltransferase family protein [Coraliomargarita sp. SDUM461004]MDQ8193832.1 biotin-dependent carboxyltransferase family protein [Coraliomargarita sp. SDUM461004]